MINHKMLNYVRAKLLVKLLVYLYVFYYSYSTGNWFVSSHLMGLKEDNKNAGTFLTMFEDHLDTFVEL